MPQPPAPQLPRVVVFPRYRWSDIENALLMEVYPRSKAAGGDLGWAEIAEIMNENARSRGIRVWRSFRENTVRSHWNDHQTQLLERYGTRGRLAAMAAGVSTSEMGSAPSSREQSVEPAAIPTFNTPPINHHLKGPPGWEPDPILPCCFSSCWNPINRPVNPPLAENAPTTNNPSQSIDTEDPSTPSVLQDNEEIATGNKGQEGTTAAVGDAEKRPEPGSP